MTLLALYNEINIALDQEEGTAKLPVYVWVHGPDEQPYLYKLGGQVGFGTDGETGERVVVIG